MKKYRKGMQLQLITDDGGCRGKLVGRNDVAICIEDGERITCLCFDMIQAIKVVKDEGPDELKEREKRKRDSA